MVVECCYLQYDHSKSVDIRLISGIRTCETILGRYDEFRGSKDHPAPVEWVNRRRLGMRGDERRCFEPQLRKTRLGRSVVRNENVRLREIRKRQIYQVAVRHKPR